MTTIARAVPAALSLGAGAAIWGHATSRWRAAVVGTIDLPAGELALAAVAAVLGAVLALAIAPRGRALLLVGAGLVVVTGVAMMAVAWLSPTLAASPIGALPTVGLPFLAIGFGGTTLLRLVAGRAAHVLAVAACGAGISLQALSCWPSPVWFAVLAVAALLLVLAGATIPTVSHRPEVGGRIAYPSAALLVGSLLTLAAQRGPRTGSGVLDPTAAFAAAFALGLWLGARSPARQRARLVALAAALLALTATGATAHREVGFDLVVPSVLVGALLAIGCAAPTPVVLGRVLAAIVFGAMLAAMGIQQEWPVAIVIAGTAVLSLLPLLRASLLSAVAIAIALAVLGAHAFSVAPPGRELGGEIVLARAGAGAAVYRVRNQDIALAVTERDVDLAGPDRHHAVLLAVLARAFARPQGDLVAIGGGTGRLHELLAEMQAGGTAMVEPCADALPLRGALAAFGPVPRSHQVAATNVVRAGSREFAWTVRGGSCAAILCGEPLLAVAPARASVDEHRALRRAVGDGVVLQCFLLGRTPPSLLAAALAAAAQVHPWCGVFLFGTTGLICGLGRAPQWNMATAVVERLPPSVRWRLHAAGVAGTADLADALLGVLPPTDGRRGDDHVLGVDARPTAPASATVANVAVLTAALGTALAPDSIAAVRLSLRAMPAAPVDLAIERLRSAVRARPDAVLLARELQFAVMAQAERAIGATDPAVPGQVAQAAQLAAQFCHLGCPSPILQAALALPDRRGASVREAVAAGTAALALDPQFAEVAPPVLAPIVRALRRHSPLADLAALPPPDRLAELAVGDSALAIALRARVPSDCAQALLAAWARSPLPNRALLALRELADPFVLDRAARALVGRSSPGELLQIWRKDLPASAPIRALSGGPADQREALLVATAGRTDPDSLDLVQRGLVDGELSVRTAAGAALFRSVGDRVVYDPEWPVERLQAAAAQLAAINQRTP